MVVSGESRPTSNSGKWRHQQSSVLIKVNPVTALTVDVTAVSMRTITKERTLWCNSRIDGFDIH
jgi:hypothetical protein